MTKKRAFFLILIALSVFCVDFETKALVKILISPIHQGGAIFPFGGVSVFENFLGIDFCLNQAANRGMAWGMLSSFQELLLVARIVVIGGLIVYTVRSSKAGPYQAPLAMVIGGAVGNVVDYFIYGHVVDMFHVIFWGYSYPIFNVADAAIFCGVSWMVLKSMQMKRNALLKTQ